MLPSLVQLAKATYTSTPTAGLAGRAFKRAQKGLFHGKMKRFGNNVPESHHKTRRTWMPNVQQKALYSATLDTMIRVKVTTAALRTIDKVGGLDEYVLKSSFDPVLGEFGRQLRERILAKRTAGAQVEQAKLVEAEARSERMRQALKGIPSVSEADLSAGKGL